MYKERNGGTKDFKDILQKEWVDIKDRKSLKEERFFLW